MAYRPTLFQMALVGLTATTAQAQNDVARYFLNPNVGQAETTLEYSTEYNFGEDIGGQGTEMRFAEHDMRLRFPIWQDETREWTMSTRLKSLDFDTDAWLPDDRIPFVGDDFPDHLWDIRLGTTYRQKLENDWLMGVDFTIGSPSDRPFASGNEIAVNTNGFLRIPDGDNNAWVFFLNWSNNREFWQYIPLPGAAYQYRPDDKLDLMVGLPFSSVRYRPLEWLEMDAFYFVPRTVRGRISLLPTENLRFYTGYEWGNERYFRHDRDDNDDRLFYDEQRVKAGVRWDITEALYVDFSGGYAFNRFFFEGEEYDDRHDSRINVGDGPFAAIQLVYRF